MIEPLKLKSIGLKLTGEKNESDTLVDKINEVVEIVNKHLDSHLTVEDRQNIEIIKHLKCDCKKKNCEFCKFIDNFIPPRSPQPQVEKKSKCECGSVQFRYNGDCLACGRTKKERKLFNSTPQPQVEECNCKEMSCPKNCERKHTHKGFFCEVCEPPQVVEECKHIEIGFNNENGEKHPYCKTCLNPVVEDKVESGWESDFDKICVYSYGYGYSKHERQLKDFIKKLLSSKEEEVRKATIEEVLKSIEKVTETRQVWLCKEIIKKLIRTN